jgi:hypothetical protein
MCWVLSHRAAKRWVVQCSDMPSHPTFQMTLSPTRCKCLAFEPVLGAAVPAFDALQILTFISLPMQVLHQGLQEAQEPSSAQACCERGVCGGGGARAGRRAHCGAPRLQRVRGAPTTLSPSTPSPDDLPPAPSEEAAVLCAAHLQSAHPPRRMQAHINHEVIKKLEAVGCEFGPCQNAYTGLEETVYELIVPTDDAAVLPQALAIFREFAFKIRRVRQPV